MRNIKEHPITLAEKLRLMDELIEEATAKLNAADAPMGGLTLVILNRIRDDIVVASREET